MNLAVFIRAFSLLLPLGWYIIGGPSSLKLFLIGGIYAVIELARASALRSLWRAWPIPVTVSFYLIAGLVAPQINFESESYGVGAAAATVCYAVPAGFCLAFLSRKDPRTVLLAFSIFALGLALAANALIRAVGIENIVKLTNESFVRENPDSVPVFLRIFKISNVGIGIIPMTMFALAALPLLAMPGWKLQKLVIIIASIGAIYVNVEVATRTTLLVAALTYPCIVTLLYLKGVIKASRMVLILFVCIVAAGVFAGASDLSGLFDPLTQRMSDVGHDVRFDVWQESVMLLWNNPLGSGKSNPSALWAHNLFLDCGLTNGIFGMASILILYGFIFYSVLRIIKKTDILAQPVGVVLVSVFVASFFIAMTEPPSPWIFAFSYFTCCYCLGTEGEAAKAYLGRKPGFSDLADRRARRA
jgi:hypothetical protein